MKRKRDNSRNIQVPVTPYWTSMYIKDSSGNMHASLEHTCGSRATDRYAFTVITIRLRGGKSYELTIRPRGVELKESKHGN